MSGKSQNNTNCPEQSGQFFFIFANFKSRYPSLFIRKYSNTMNLHSLLPILLSFVMVSCNGNKASQNKSENNSTVQQTEKTIQFVNSLRLKNPHRGDLFTIGEEVKIVVTPRRKAEDIDSIHFLVDEKVITSSDSEPWKVIWTPKENNMGRHNLKVLAYHDDGTIGVVSTFINLKSNKAPVEYTYEIVNSFPHDKRAYTQGLFYHDGFLFEGTGKKGSSTLRKVKLEDGQALSVKNLEQEYFGEGITYCNGKIIQLTWTSGKAFVINPDSFEQEDVFTPQTSNDQAWGITTANNELVISDGTNILSFLDPVNYSTNRIIEVYDEKGKVTNLNELEYINGKIYANVWLTDKVVIINPISGRVEGNISLNEILKTSEKQKLDKHDDVLNGIAWDSINNRMFVTGKRWPKLFEIKIK